MRTKTGDHEVIVGTWVGIAVIADAFVRAGLIEREAITTALTEAIIVTRPSERTQALQAMLFFVEQLGRG
jgi:hypothetical protein